MGLLFLGKALTAVVLQLQRVTPRVGAPKDKFLLSNQLPSSASLLVLCHDSVHLKWNVILPFTFIDFNPGSPFSFLFLRHFATCYVLDVRSLEVPWTRFCLWILVAKVLWGPVLGHHLVLQG